MSEVIVEETMRQRLQRVLFVMVDNDWPSPDHPRCAYIAQRMLEAMRKPTEAMLTAEGETNVGYRERLGGYLDYWSADGVWTAMIDEALKP
jgi:LmbE family N-acetylglucosaminyl deacetylase